MSTSSHEPDWEYLSRFLGRPVGELRRLGGIDLLRLIREALEREQRARVTRVAQALHGGAHTAGAHQERYREER